MEQKDPNIIVDEMLRITSTSVPHLDGATWRDSWWQTILESDVGSLEPATPLDLEAVLQQDVDNAQRRTQLMHEQEEIMNQDPELYEKVKGVIDHRLEQLGFTADEVKAVSGSPKRLLLLSRALAGLEVPSCRACPDVSPAFVIRVARQYFVSSKGYNTRTLHFAGDVSWTKFHRSLQDNTTNWQIATELGYHRGLSPENGTWLYAIQNKSETDASDEALKNVLDGPKAFADMKELLLRAPQLAVILVHDKLQSYRKKTMADHEELCDRTGGTGDGAISTNGHPFEETFDLEDYVFGGYDDQGEASGPRRDSTQL